MSSLLLILVSSFKRRCTMNGHVEVDGLLQDKGRGMEMPKDGDGVDGASEGEESDDLELHELAKETTGFVPDESNEGGFEEGQSQPKPGHRARTQSLSSISFAFDMLPLLLSRETVDPAESQREVKHLDLTSGIALVVGLQIGSGVFSSPVSTEVAKKSRFLLIANLLGDSHCRVW